MKLQQESASRLCMDSLPGQWWLVSGFSSSSSSICIIDLKFRAPSVCWTLGESKHLFVWTSILVWGSRWCSVSLCDAHLQWCPRGLSAVQDHKSTRVMIFTLFYICFYFILSFEHVCVYVFFYLNFNYYFMSFEYYFIELLLIILFHDAFTVMHLQSLRCPAIQEYIF